MNFFSPLLLFLYKGAWFAARLELEHPWILPYVNKDEDPLTCLGEEECEWKKQLCRELAWKKQIGLILNNGMPNTSFETLTPEGQAYFQNSGNLNAGDSLMVVHALNMMPYLTVVPVVKEMRKLECRKSSPPTEKKCLYTWSPPSVANSEKICEQTLLNHLGDGYEWRPLNPNHPDQIDGGLLLGWNLVHLISSFVGSPNPNELQSIKSLMLDEFDKPWFKTSDGVNKNVVYEHAKKIIKYWDEPQWAEIILALFHQDPECRPSLSDILTSSWMQGGMTEEKFDAVGIPLYWREARSWVKPVKCV